jgi:hypothetical protein
MIMKRILISSIVFVALGISTISRAPEKRPTKGPALAGYYLRMAQQREKVGFLKSLGLGAMTGGFLGVPMGGAAMGYRDRPTDAIKVMAALTTLGALGNALVDAYNPWTTSPAWTAQVKKLEDAIMARPGEVITENTVLIGGIPAYEISRGNKDKDYGGRPYLLSAKYHDVSSNADVFYLRRSNGYEFYLMPKDENLIDIFLLLNSEDEKIKKILENVAFIVFSLRPDVSKSIWSNKNLPRIMIGLKPGPGVDGVSEKQKATMFALALSELLGGYSGIGYRPWYSAEIEVPDATNKLIYASYGSGDYKETKEGQKEYAAKKNKSWRSWISSDVEDMAYKNDDQRIDITNMSSQRNRILNIRKAKFE